MPRIAVYYNMVTEDFMARAGMTPNGPFNGRIVPTCDTGGMLTANRNELMSWGIGCA